MIIPNDDPMKEEGVKKCIEFTLDFFKEVWPEKAAELGITLDDAFTVYSLAKTDDEFIRLIGNQFGIDIDDEAKELNNREEQ